MEMPWEKDKEFKNPTKQTEKEIGTDSKNTKNTNTADTDHC